MNKAYNRTYWKNYPSIDSPVNEQNLNNIEVGVDEIDNRVIVLDTTKASKLEVSELFGDVSFDEQTGIITFTRKNGATLVIDTALEKIATGIYYNPTTEMLTVPLIDGTQYEVDLSRLITEYEFEDSDTIAFSVTDGKVSAIVKEGSIEEKHLRPDYLADIRVESAKAKSSADAAEESADNAAESATEAESYAHGGTGTREDENTDNAKEYARQAKASAESAAEIVGGNFIPLSEKGEAGGVATLDDDGKVPEEQLPSGIGGGNPDNVTIIKNEDGTLTAVSVGFTGTQEEYEAAEEAGEIEDGTIINITDDYAPVTPPDNESVKILLQQQQGIYEGRDLTQVFANEIAEFSDPWAWIKNRIVNANYDGIYIADFIPMTVNGETHEMQVAGIDTYYRTTDQNLGHHIDFISRDCYSQKVQWNTTNNNNGNATNPCPYMVSNLKAFLDTLYESLPTAVKNVVVTKRTLLERRYSASGALTDSTSWSWENIGKLWVPTECEVFGSAVWGTKGYSAMQDVQYPIFRNSWKNRIKGSGPNGSQIAWWMASVRSGNSAYACNVSGSGIAESFGVSNVICAPLCIRIDDSQ